MSSSDDMTAHVERDADGNLVLIDPVGFAVMQAVARVNLDAIVEANAGRIKHFMERFRIRECTPDEICIVLINVDDEPVGREIANRLCPGMDSTWEELRAQGMVPFARGLAGREFIQVAVELFDTYAAEVLKSVPDKLVVVVVSHGVANVYDPETGTPIRHPDA